ncbi:MAG: hypothetical protein ACK5HT_10230, partial [Draconibacterium sp.]
MKRAGIITGVLVLLLAILYFTATGPVNQEPYFESDYYKESCSKIDGLKENYTPSKDSLLAGFAKVSITPVLNTTEDNAVEGK